MLWRQTLKLEQRTPTSIAKAAEHNVQIVLLYEGAVSRCEAPGRNLLSGKGFC